LKNDLRKTDKLKVLSLFSGCGGLDLGFIGGFKSLNKDYPKRKFELIWANEIDKGFCKTYKENFKHDIVEADIREILAGHSSNRSQLLPQYADIVLGGKRSRKRSQGVKFISP
jgi:DNA (cytosine-5)-methyltransferase 1